jgi:hypothetical protein
VGRKTYYGFQDMNSTRRCGNLYYPGQWEVKKIFGDSWHAHHAESDLPSSLFRIFLARFLRQLFGLERFRQNDQFKTLIFEEQRKRTPETAPPARCPDGIVSAMVIYQQSHRNTSQRN